MANTTSRLALTQPVGTDPVSELRTAITANAAILDNAATVASGTLAARPGTPAQAEGALYLTTDTVGPYVSIGGAWTGLATLDANGHVVASQVANAATLDVSGTLTVTSSATVTGAISASGSIVCGETVTAHEVVVNDGATGQVAIVPSGVRNYIESGNEAWNAPQDLELAGYSGEQMTNLFLNAAKTRLEGGLQFDQTPPATGAYSGDLIILPSGNYLFEGGASFGGFANPSYLLGLIDANGSTFTSGMLAGHYYTASDERLKADIQPIDDALAAVRRIRGVTHTWCDSEDDRRELAVIAQEVEQAAPQAVATTGDDGIRAVDYGRLVPLLIEAVKELADRIDTREAD